MTRSRFIEAVLKFCSKKQACEIADSYTDSEIKESGTEIVSELEEDFRLCANINRYQRCGY